MDDLEERMKKIEDKQSKQDVDMALQKREQGYLKDSIDQLSSNIASLTAIVTSIQQKPAANWEKAVWIVLSAIIGLAVGKFF